MAARTRLKRDVTGINCVTFRHRNGYRGFRKTPSMPCPSFPPEVLDIIVDFLDKEFKALRNCCLVAKSWVPRTRKYLFLAVTFPSPQHLESWKTFLDPSNSPAHHTHSLSIRCPHVATAGDAEEGGWIRTFSRVLCLDIASGLVLDSDDTEVSFTPFHGFSPVLKTLRLFWAGIKLTDLQPHLFPTPSRKPDLSRFIR